MRAVSLWSFAALLPSATSSAAQQVSSVLPPEAANVAIAAVDWYADVNRQSAPRGRTIVVSEQTSDYVVSPYPGSPGYRVERDISRTLRLGRAALDRIQQSYDVRIETCDMFENLSLCGVAQPWVWLVLTTPVIEEDRAVIALEARELNFGPPPATEATRVFVRYVVFLVRIQGIWRVDSVRRAGEG